MDNRKVIDRTLKQVGVPNSLLGHTYISSVLEKSIPDRNFLKRIVNGVYVNIAKENDTTPLKVERAIRHAVEVAWIRGNIKALEKIFGYTVDMERGRPTNAEFLSCMRDFIVLYGDEVMSGEYIF